MVGGGRRWQESVGGGRRRQESVGGSRIRAEPAGVDEECGPSEKAPERERVGGEQATNSRVYKEGCPHSSEMISVSSSLNLFVI